MRSLFEILLAGVLLGCSVYVYLFGHPMPPDYERWPIEASAMLLGVTSLWFAAGVWGSHPELRPILALVLFLALAPVAYKVLNWGPLPLF